jgi:chromosome partitioning protein
VYSLQGISQIYETIEAVKKYCNPQLTVAGILIVRFNPRIILNRDILAIMEQTATQMGTRVFNTRIRESIAIREAQARKLDLFSYEPESNGALDYTAFIKEYAEELNG